MTGIVNKYLEATLQLLVLDAGGVSHEIEAVIDTGYSSCLTLPAREIESLGLQWLCRQRGQLADGTLQDFEVYKGVVVWDGQPRSIEIDAANASPLLGMEMMQGCEMQMRIIPGGVVSITPIS